jgi:hypothetical protein
VSIREKLEGKFYPSLFLELLPPFFFGLIVVVDRLTFYDLMTGAVPVRGFFRPYAAGTSAIFNYGGLFFFYLVPLIAAIAIGAKRRGEIKKSQRPVMEVLRLVFLYALVWLLPFVALLFGGSVWNSSQIFVSLAYVFILIPTILALGISIAMAGIKRSMWPKKDMREFLKKGTSLLILVIIVFAVVKLSLVYKANYPVGSDVYYHTALSLNIVEGASPLQSPLFLGLNNTYPPLPHIIVAYTSKITGITVVKLWPLIDLLVQILILCGVYYLARYLTKSDVASFVAVVLILPWDQFMMEVSSRRFALALVPVVWVLLVQWGEGREKKYIAGAGGLLVLSLCCHLLIFLITLFTAAVYILAIMLEKPIKYVLRNIGYYLVPYDYVNLPEEKRRESRYLLPSIVAPFLLISGIVIFMAIMGQREFGLDSLNFFGEALISFTRPLGIISIILVPFGIVAIPFIFKDNYSKHTLVLAVSSLFLGLVVYLTKFGVFFPALGINYIRIISEIPGIMLAICAAVVIYNYFIPRKESGELVLKYAVVFVLLVLVVLSIYPKMSLNYSYAETLDNRMKRMEGILLAVSKLGPNSVIIANPNDWINRYIPGVAGRYIFIAEYRPTVTASGKVERGRILNTLGGGGIGEANELKARIKNSRAYWDDWSNTKFLKKLVKKYSITHILVNADNRKMVRFFGRNENFKHVYSDKHYVLYEICKS